MKKLLLLWAIIMPFAFYSCGDDNDDGEDILDITPEDQYTIDEQTKYLSSRLFNTSWTYQYTEFYNNNGSYSHTTSEFANKFTLTFSNEICGNNIYKLIINGNSDAFGCWCIDEDGVYYNTYGYTSEIAKMTSFEYSRWMECGGFIINGYISTQTNSKLIIKRFSYDGINYDQRIFTASSNSGGGSGNNSGGSGDIEEFYETNFSSTAYKNKITVNFYFSDRVTSATIKYGTTSSCSSSKSATVSAKSAYATISGLKSGTKYYFKCVAKSKTGQSCTTLVYPVMTNY